MSDNTHDKTLTGEQFRNIFLKNQEDEFTKEYFLEDIYAETSQIRAQREAEERKPNGQPIAASIIPARYTYGRWMQEQNTRSIEPFKQPTYIIDSSVWIGNSFTAETLPLEINYPIIIRNCIFKSTVNIQHIKCKFDISFLNCVFENKIILDNVEANSISFKYSHEHESNIKIINCKLNYLTIKSCRLSICKIDANQIAKKLIIFDVKINELSLLTNESNYTDIKAISSESIEVELTDNTFQFSNDFLKFESSIVVLTDDLYVKNVLFYFSEKADKSKITIRSLKTGSFTFTGILAGKSAVLKDIIVTNLEIVDFTNNGQLLFQNVTIRPTGYCLIKNSTLGITIFTNVNLSTASYISIIGSNLLSITLINTFFPNSIIGNTNDDYLGQREAYKQLKQLYSKQSDKLQEMKASRHELDAFNKSLTFREDFFDKSVLLLNRISNKYGFDVKQGFLSVLITSVFFYSLYCWFLGFLPGRNIELFGKLLSYMLEFINPLHKADFIPDDLKVKVNSFARLWEGVSRIFISYFLYQFIQAFRKFGK